MPGELVLNFCDHFIAATDHSRTTIDMARKTARQGIKPFSASSSAPADRKPKQKAKKDKSQSAYTYIPSLPKRHRTSEQTLSLSREEAELGKPRRRNDEEDSDDDMNKRIRKVAMMIAEEGPGGVESDESDVDSDEAWEDDGSDEERWGDVFRDLEKGKKKKSGKKEEERVLKVSDLDWRMRLNLIHSPRNL